MEFIADFHIHSRFSRATAKNLDLENLYIAAQLKGITVIGTGDFTHPGWFAEIKDKLVSAEQGLFKLREDIAKHCDQQVPKACRREVRFMLVSEISNIYKKKKRTRKNHNLVFFSDIDAVEKFNWRLDRIGNIHSDGRPILGLDARNLLEIILDVSEMSFLVPAHIWTPWFSMFGSKSGFDSIEECFEDLTSHIFAVETGLSSDPSMNWRVSKLDGLTLISNSDAHSPLKMGREANLFNTTLSFSEIKKALESGNPEQFLGTLEFYPEEGKYHLDGHRKCEVRQHPKLTKKTNGICPVCHKPLTLGVMYRVEELADRPEGEKPQKTHPFYNLIPLVEILSEVLKVGTGSKKVKNNYMSLLEKFGAELTILNLLEIETIERGNVPLLGEAIKRMRQKKIKLLPGYDGEFGKISIFDPQERDKLLGQKSLFIMPETAKILKKDEEPKQISITKKLDERQIDELLKEEQKNNKAREEKLIKLNHKQMQAVAHTCGPLMVIAGPGTGKTRTLTHRISHLIAHKNIPPENILAITFTHRAAVEMRERIEKILGCVNPLPFIGTFHSFCFEVLKDYKKNPPAILDEEDRNAVIVEAIRQVEKKGEKVNEKPQTFLDWIIFAKQNIIGPWGHAEHIPDAKKNLFSSIYESYQNILSLSGLCDFEDLIFDIVQLFETEKAFVKNIRNRFKFVFVDEYQDLNHGQYRMLTSIIPPDSRERNICVIGDPHQAIYGFRGSDVKYFNAFINDYPGTTMVNLTRNYRSTQTILDVSQQIIKKPENETTRIFSKINGINTISIIEAASDRSEAVAVGKTIENLIGGVGFHSLDFGTVDGTKGAAQRSFSDFAVLFRTTDQIRTFSKIFDAAGIPYQVVSRKRIFDEKDIKVLLSFLKISEGGGSFIDFERIMRWKGSGFNKREIESFKSWCYEKKLPLSSALFHAKRFPIKKITKNTQRKLSVLIDIIAKTKKATQGLTMEKKLVYLRDTTPLLGTKNADEKIKEAMNHLLGMAKSAGSNMSYFFSQTSLKTDTDTYSPHAERVALMTMHTAKGLEFPVVFVSGCENGLLPFWRPGKDETDIDEERRLFYVAVTRAQERVYLTYAKKRQIYGQTEMRQISPFVNDIEEALKIYDKPVYKQKSSEQLKLF